MEIRIKTLCSIAPAILLASLGVALAQTQSSPGKDGLVGAWKLVELDRPGPDGKLTKVDCDGLFVFTHDGHLSVQVMDRETKAQNSAASSQQYSQNGYEASYGSYVVDTKSQTFTFRVEGALVRSLVGKDLLRRYELLGNRLIVKSARPDEHWKVIWERY